MLIDFGFPNFRLQAAKLEIFNLELFIFQKIWISLTRYGQLGFRPNLANLMTSMTYSESIFGGTLRSKEIETLHTYCNLTCFSKLSPRHVSAPMTKFPK